MIGYRVPAPHGRQVALREAGVTGELRDAADEPVGDGRLLGFEQVERVGGVDGV